MGLLRSSMASLMVVLVHVENRAVWEESHEEIQVLEHWLPCPPRLQTRHKLEYALQSSSKSLVNLTLTANPLRESQASLEATESSLTVQEMGSSITTAHLAQPSGLNCHNLVSLWPQSDLLESPPSSHLPLVSPTTS
jgi:hypothetical protein